ncbi:MAG: hypothetical protein P4L38_00010 [Syntrophaceae bacterium]|nr:hypothetical protein [Syntrophaceae bacterium]
MQDKTQKPPVDELAGLRSRAEATLPETSVNHSDISGLSTVETQELVHELHVHQIELKMQNEELLRIQRELGESLNRYQNLYDFAPISYITVDGKGFILEANLMAPKYMFKWKAWRHRIDRVILLGREL